MPPFEQQPDQVPPWQTPAVPLVRIDLRRLSDTADDDDHARRMLARAASAREGTPVEIVVRRNQFPIPGALALFREMAQHAAVTVVCDDPTTADRWVDTLNVGWGWMR